MIIRMLRQSWRRNPRRKLLAVVTVFLAASLLSALMTLSIDIGDKMARELKSYGANILIEPTERAVIPALFGESNGNPPASRNALDEKEMTNIPGIFWHNNIVGFAPLLTGTVEAGTGKLRVIGTFFEHRFPVPDDPDYRTGQKIISPYWQVAGTWPDDRQSEALAGAQLAQAAGWKPGDRLAIGGDTVVITGLLSTGGEEENALIVPLALAQKWLKLPGKVQNVRVSALTVPENDLSRKALKNPDALDAATYDLWYCTAYVSSIAHQLEEAVSGSIARPIWQVAASEGVIIGKIQWLLMMATLAALVAAGMGIAALMTSTLIERSAEIGLMKALGAHNWQIGLLFYSEAIFSSVLGGLAGCLTGWAIAQGIGRQLFGVSLDFSWVTVPAILLISVLIALTGTWFPARRIARLFPVEVLYGRH